MKPEDAKGRVSLLVTEKNKQNIRSIHKSTANTTSHIEKRKVALDMP